MSTDVAEWEAVLAEYQARLAELADAVRSTDADAPLEMAGWSPPEGLGPMPAELAGRASLLAEETTRLESEYRVKMKSVLKEMQSNRRRPHPGTERAGSSFVDFTA